MNYDQLSMAHGFVQMIPSIVTTLIAIVAWLLVCKWIYRDGEKAFRDATRKPTNFGEMTIAEQVTILHEQRRVAAAGSPADRAFTAGIVFASVLMFLYSGAFLLGFTPARGIERKAIEDVRAAHQDQPAVRAALRVADDSLYLSKGDAERILQAAVSATR